MKKVILENKKEVYLSDLNENSIVGILWEYEIKKAVFTSNHDVFVVKNDKIRPEIYNNTNVVKYINQFVGIEVFLFNTMKELFKWLSED
jgi:hypothetical protein